MMKLVLVNNFAAQRLINDIKNPDMSVEAKRDKDVELFLKFLSTPRTEREVQSVLNMLLNSEHARTMEGLSLAAEPKKVFVNEEKRTVAVLWKDGVVTKAKCHKEDEFDVRVGYSICYLKHKEEMTNKERDDFFKNVLPSITEYYKKEDKKASKVEEKLVKIITEEKPSNEKTEEKVVKKTTNSTAKTKTTTKKCAKSE